MQLHCVDNAVEEEVRVLRLRLLDPEGDYVVRGGLQDLEGRLQGHPVEGAVVDGQKTISGVEGTGSVGGGAPTDFGDEEGLFGTRLRGWNNLDKAKKCS